MNVLDENVIDSQRQLLRHWRFAMRHMGYDVGRQGMKDQEIIALLHRLRRPTFFTRDEDFYARRLCHARYCLVYMKVETMRKHYDFSQAKPNPYAKRLQKAVTVRLDEHTMDYCEALAAETGVPARTLISLYLRECAASRKRLALRWKPAA